MISVAVTGESERLIKGMSSLLRTKEGIRRAVRWVDLVNNSGGNRGEKYIKMVSHFIQVTDRKIIMRNA